MKAIGKRIVTAVLLAALLSCMVIFVQADDHDALTVQTRSGTFSFNVGTDFTYSYWLDLSPEAMKKLADLAPGDISKYIQNFTAPTMKDFAGTILFDKNYLSVEEMSVPNITNATILNFGLSDDSYIQFGKTPLKSISTEEAEQFRQNTLLVRVKFHVDAACEYPIYLRTKMSRLDIAYNGKELSFIDGKNSMAEGPFVSYETINDAPPTFVLNPYVSDQKFDIRCCRVPSDTENFFYPGAGICVSMMGAGVDVKYTHLRRYTKGERIFTFYDVPYGEYYVKCSFTSDNGVYYATPSPTKAEVVSIPSTGVIQDLWLFETNSEDVKSVKVTVNWQEDNGYLPVRPEFLRLTLSDSENVTDALYATFLAPTDTAASFDYVKRWSSSGEEMRYSLFCEPGDANTEYSYTVIPDGDNFIVNARYIGAKSKLGRIAPDENGHYWERQDALSTRSSCSQEGMDYYLCLVCHEIKVTRYPAGQHSFINYQYNNDATCTKNGSKTAMCAYGCGASDTVEAEGTMLPHRFTDYQYDHNATCTENGSETAACSFGCGTTDTREAAGTKLPHLFENYTSDGNATCMANGTQTACCAYGCGACNTVEEPDSRTGHKFTVYISDENATETENGTKTAFCDYGCGATDTVPDEGSGGNHSFSVYVYNNDATCTRAGTETAECDEVGCTVTNTRWSQEHPALGHSFVNYTSNHDATCTEDGTKTAVCERCSEKNTVPDTGSATGHAMKNGICEHCGYVEGYAVHLPELPAGAGRIFADGHEFAWQGGETVVLDSPDYRLLTLSTMNSTEGDVHSLYPTHLYVWALHYGEAGYSAERLSALDDALQYAGSSIRIVGKKGIRMITSVPQSIKNELIAGGAGGYTLLEYGTLVAWEDTANGNPVTFELEGVRSAYAYKKDEADPVFAQANGLVQYTNVLVGFSDDQCIPDLLLRPYMKLLSPDGEELILYGGIVQRSIGYIAYQNRNAFSPGTDSYDYIWGIIHHVYGDAYDAEYRG